MPFLIWNLIPLTDHDRILVELEQMEADLSVRAQALENVACQLVDQASNLRERAAFVALMRETIEA